MSLISWASNLKYYIQGYRTQKTVGGYMIGEVGREPLHPGMFMAPDRKGKVWIAPTSELAKEIALATQKLNLKTQYDTVYAVAGEEMRTKHLKNGLILTRDTNKIKIVNCEGHVKAEEIYPFNKDLAAILKWGSEYTGNSGEPEITEEQLMANAKKILPAFMHMVNQVIAGIGKECRE